MPVVGRLSLGESVGAVAPGTKMGAGDVVLAGLLLRGMAITPCSSGYICGAPSSDPAVWIATNPAKCIGGKRSGLR